MNYTDVVTRLSTLTENNQTDDWKTALLVAIDYAEQRIYRELNLAANSTRNSAFKVAAGSHVLSLPTGTFVTITGINVVTPTNVSNPDLGARTPLTPTSWDYIDAVYGSATTSAIPQFFALQDASTIAFGPWPDATYPLEIIGTTRPAPLSASNTTTWLTLYLPDLFIAAAMISMSGYMRNYGAQSDDPQQGVTWEQQYGKLLASAQAEEVRKQFGAPN